MTAKFRTPLPQYKPSGSRVALGTLGIRVAFVGLEFACTVLLARTLGSSEFGVYALAMSIVSVLAVAGAAGLDRLGIREVATLGARGLWAETRGFVFQSNSIAFVASLIVVLLAIVAATSSAASLSSASTNTLLVGLALIPMLALLRTNQAALQGMGFVALGQAPELILQPSVMLALTAVAALALGKLNTGTQAIALQCIAALVATAVAMSAVTRLLDRGGRNRAATVSLEAQFRRTVPFAWITIMATAIANADVIACGILLDAESAGLYKAAAQIAGAAAFPVTAVNMAFAPRIARSYALNGHRGLQSLVDSAARLMIALSMTAAVTVAVGGPWILGLFGESFSSGYPLLLLIVSVHLVTAAMGTAGYVLIMTGRERIAASILTLATILSIVANIVLVPRFGVFGAGLATLFGTALATGGYAVVAFRKLGVKPIFWPRTNAQRWPRSSTSK